MDFILITLFHAFLFWVAFKLGEHFTYFRIARNLTMLKEEAKSIVETTNGVARIEQIGDRYYAYIDNTFVAQGDTVEKVQEAVRAAIEKEPSKYFSALKEQNINK